MIFKFSFYELSDAEKSVLFMGLNFSVERKSIEYSEFLLSLKFLFRDVKQVNLSSEDLSLMKARLLDTIFFEWPKSTWKLLVWIQSFKDKNKKQIIAFRKADKGNTIMILDEISIIRANWRNIKWLNDHVQFYNLDIFAGK